MKCKFHLSASTITLIPLPLRQVVFHLFAVIAEFERELIRERTNAGLKAARARGEMAGARQVNKRHAEQSIISEGAVRPGRKSMKEIAADLSISEATAYRYLMLPGSI
jgi:DNA invertase Pin-like site-specific DNA recombinase